MNARNQHQATPLHIAVELGRGDLATLLTAKGSDVNAKNVDGFTPLDLATQAGNTAMLALLQAPHALVSGPGASAAAVTDGKTQRH